MIIKGLKIKRFGNLEDKELHFNEGINLIYGGNESGKSTLQNFIKGWLYGMPSKRSRSIRDNSRIRFAINASGELLAEESGREIRIIRSFGSTKKEDTSLVIDEITGEKVSGVSFEEPGRDLLNIKLESFENTLFIKGLGTPLNSSKDDEVMHRLINSLESGEEGVSFFKAVAKLDALKKEITTVRGNGYLDKLKEIRFRLMEERDDFKTTSQKNIQDELKVIELRKQKEEIKVNLKKLDFYKKHLRKMKLQKEYKDILEYLKKSQELKRKAEEIHITQDVNDELKEEVAVILNLKDIGEKKRLEGTEILEEQKALSETLEEYKCFEELGQDLEDRLLDMARESESYKGQLLVYEENQKEIQGLRKRIHEIEMILGKAADIEEHEERIDVVIKEYEDALYMLKNKISLKVPGNVGEEIKSMKRNHGIILGLFVLSAALSGVLIFLKPVFSLFSLLTSGILLSMKFKLSKKVDKLSEASSIQEEIRALEERISIKERELREYVKILKLSSMEELGGCLNKFKKYKEEIKVIRRLASEREENSGYQDIGKIKDVVERNINMLKSIEAYTGCSSMEEVLIKVREYKGIRAREEIVKGKWKNYQESYESLCLEENRREEILRGKLTALGLQNTQLEDLPKELDKIIEKIKERDQILNSLKTADETYKALLKDRDIENLRMELEEILSENIEYSFETEEETDNEIKSCNSRLIVLEKELKDAENSIYNRFLGKRSLISIEGDLEETNEKIDELTFKLKALEVCSSLMEDSFRELQRNIGPALNKKVSYYFSKLTSGKYSEVKVGQNYEIMVKEEDGETFSGEYLSNGAWDQVYLSLRLALVDMLFGEKKVPLIFDDAFVQYDDERLKNTLEVLKELSLKRQIILFSCQKREEEFLEDSINLQ
ncbi:MAG: AAA family ATPase [Clostridiaceae bacterium]